MAGATAPDAGGDGPLEGSLAYRPPLDRDSLLAFLAPRATPGVEAVLEGSYLRTITLGGHRGSVRVALAPGDVPAPAGAGRPDTAVGRLRLRASRSLSPVLDDLVARLGRLFDLDADTTRIEGHLAHSPVLRRLVRRHPGLRVPGAVDGFELAVRAILGQQVSVAAATTLAGRLAEAFGEPAEPDHPALTRHPPGAERLAAAPTDRLAAIGLPRARARAIRELAGAVAYGELKLEPGPDPEGTLDRLRAIPGIGAWTAAYVALRALRLPDAFPASDAGLRRALGGIPASELEGMAESWRPWRAYAAAHLWRSLAPAPAGGGPGLPSPTGEPA